MTPGRRILNIKCVKQKELIKIWILSEKIVWLLVRSEIVLRQLHFRQWAIISITFYSGKPKQHPVPNCLEFGCQIHFDIRQQKNKKDKRTHTGAEEIEEKHKTPLDEVTIDQKICAEISRLFYCRWVFLLSSLSPICLAKRGRRITSEANCEGGKRYAVIGTVQRSIMS